MSTGSSSPHGDLVLLAPVIPQGATEDTAQSVMPQLQVQAQALQERQPLTLEHPSNGHMLDFYVEMKRQAGQEAPPLIPLEDLQAFYAMHIAPLPQLPTPADVAGALVLEEDVITRDEA